MGADWHECCAIGCQGRRFDFEIGAFCYRFECELGNVVGLPALTVTLGHLNASAIIASCWKPVVIIGIEPTEYAEVYHAHLICSGGGQYLGISPGSKVSMTIMRPPQWGQVLGSSTSLFASSSRA